MSSSVHTSSNNSSNRLELTNDAEDGLFAAAGWHAADLHRVDQAVADFCRSTAYFAHHGGLARDAAARMLAQLGIKPVYTSHLARAFDRACQVSTCIFFFPLSFFFFLPLLN